MPPPFIDDITIWYGVKYQLISLQRIMKSSQCRKYGYWGNLSIFDNFGQFWVINGHFNIIVQDCKVTSAISVSTLWSCQIEMRGQKITYIWSVQIFRQFFFKVWSFLDNAFLFGSPLIAKRISYEKNMEF